MPITTAANGKPEYWCEECGTEARHGRGAKWYCRGCVPEANTAKLSGHSSTVERLPSKQGMIGSNPTGRSKQTKQMDLF